MQATGSPPPRVPMKASGQHGPVRERTIKRSTFSPEQLQTLEAAFEVNPLPNLALRHGLAEKLGLTPRTVQVWFQNRRQKVKKQQAAAGARSAETSDGGEPAEVGRRQARVSSPAGLPPPRIPHSSSTGSFEFMAHEFERLRPLADDNTRAGNAARRPSSPPDTLGARLDAIVQERLAGTFLTRPGAGPALPGAGHGPSIGEYRQWLEERCGAHADGQGPASPTTPPPAAQEHSRSADPSAKLKRAESLDAAANLLFFSATAAGALLHQGGFGPPTSVTQGAMHA